MQKLEALKNEAQDSPLTKSRSHWYTRGFSTASSKYVEVVDSSESSVSDDDDEDRQQQSTAARQASPESYIIVTEESKDVCYTRPASRNPKKNRNQGDMEEREEFRRVYRVEKHRRLLKRKLMAQLAKLKKWETSGFCAAVERE